MKTKRVLSIDVMRGLTLFLMLFVNDLYVPGVPAWLAHRAAGFDGMGLADWVFPGFLFMVGMAVPFAIRNRLKRGDSNLRIVYHIMVRTLSLLLIGVLMMNVGRLNPELTGMPKYLWAILTYVAIFMVWNAYPENKPKLALWLKSTGAVALLILMAVFRGGTPEETTWLVTGWWGILGLIGWGYLVTSLAYLGLKDNLPAAGLLLLGFVLINALSMLGKLDFLDFAKPVFGVIIDGNVPSIVMAGLFFSLLLRRLKTDPRRFVYAATAFGVAALVMGFVLRNWFIISKIQGTPSWAMICNGISILLFVLLYILMDIKGIVGWSGLFKMAGRNSLTTYLAPNIVYYAIWLGGLPVLVYKLSEHSGVIILGSLVWSAAMILLANSLAKRGIRLKL